jgi:hypothetical protein
MLSSERPPLFRKWAAGQLGVRLICEPRLTCVLDLNSKRQVTPSICQYGPKSCTKNVKAGALKVYNVTHCRLRAHPDLPNKVSGVRGRRRVDTV